MKVSDEMMIVRVWKSILLLAVALLAFSTANAQDAKASVYKISEAGIQVNVPAGWKVEKDAKGVVLFSKKDAEGYVLFSASVLESHPAITFDELFTAFSEGVFEQ